MKRVSANIQQLTLRYFGAPVAVYLVRDEQGSTLIDAGPPGTAGQIINAVQSTLGQAPHSIVVTHGHLDHVGALGELARHWDVPVYAHIEEVPYIQGKQRFRDLRPASLGHRVLSRFVPQVDYPELAISPLPEGDVCSDLQIVHVPGHAPGMIALLHRADGVCLAADAFRFKPWGAMPMLTYDYALARTSMRKLLALDFDWLCTSHGEPVPHSVAERWAR